MREALFRLELEGYVKVAFRSGWSVAPFDFHKLVETSKAEVRKITIHKLHRARPVASEL